MTQTTVSLLLMLFCSYKYQFLYTSWWLQCALVPLKLSFATQCKLAMVHSVIILSIEHPTDRVGQV